MKITTNNQYRHILYFHELEQDEQDELKDSYDTVEGSSFFKYRGHVYDLNEFMSVNNALNGKGKDHDLYGWDGYQNETFFSSVLVKYSECGEAVRVGLALS